MGTIFPIRAPVGRPPRPGSVAAAARRLPVLSVLALAACQPAVLDPQGPVAHAGKTLLIDSVAIMLAIVGPTVLATVAFAWWFREGNARARYWPDWAYSGQIELVTWGVPLLTITLLGGVAWVGAHQLDPAQPLGAQDQVQGQTQGQAQGHVQPGSGAPRPEAQPLEVQVVSLDWKWLFILPDQQIAAVNQLTVPAGRPVHFSLTSASVMNAFFVPQLGSMIYTMNGMTTQLYLQADRPGTYRGLSTHYSGDGFSDMHFELRAADAAGFAAWVDAARRDGPALDDARYRELAKQSMRVIPHTYRTVEARLFQRIVDQEVPPAPGPRPGKGGQSEQSAEAARPDAARVASLEVGICAMGER